MSRFNVSQNHPIINNSQDYMYEKQYIVIHSTDRNCIKFPSASEYEIELPQDYTNVQCVKLTDWVFPSNFYTFALYQNNLVMTFKITNPFNPGAYNIFNTLLSAIFRALYANINFEYIIVIEEGFYTAAQMVVELTNKLNQSVSAIVRTYMATDPQTSASDIALFNTNGGYNQFVVAYNQVKQNIWIGNKSSGFTLTNDSTVYCPDNIVNTTSSCVSDRIDSFLGWGLPAYLGFTRCQYPATQTLSSPYYNLPRFFYDNGSQYSTTPVNGLWLQPDAAYISQNTTPANVFYVEASLKVNLLGPTDMFMEIDGLNNLDETSPFTNDAYTMQTNSTNGVVKSSFAKFPITASPPGLLYTLYAPSNISFKLFNPPAERIRRLKVKIRFHNGLLVPFGNSEYSFTLEFSIYKPQINTGVNKMFIPEAIAYG